MSQRNYQALEYGEIKPSYDTLLKICEYLDVSADYLLGLSDTKHQQSNIVNNNGAIVSNSNLRHSNINVNSNELTAYAKELIDIYKNLDSRNQIKLLSYAFELEKQK